MNPGQLQEALKALALTEDEEDLPRRYKRALFLALDRLKSSLGHLSLTSFDDKGADGLSRDLDELYDQIDTLLGKYDLEGA